jgi:hypothetical protein
VSGPTPTATGNANRTPSPTGGDPDPTAGDTPSAFPTPGAEDTPTATYPPTETGAERLVAATFEREGALDGWTVRTRDSGEGEASVRDGRVRLLVSRCSRVVARSMP